MRELCAQKDSWMRQMILQNPRDPYWQMVSLALAWFGGILLENASPYPNMLRNKPRKLREIHLHDEGIFSSARLLEVRMCDILHLVIYRNINFDMVMLYYRHGSMISAQYQRPCKMAKFYLNY